MKTLYKVDIIIITRSNVNINCLVKRETVFWYDAKLRCYNLHGIVEFPTRFQTLPTTAIENIFTDALTINYYIISSLISTLSDHYTL